MPRPAAARSEPGRERSAHGDGPVGLYRRWVRQFYDAGVRSDARGHVSAENAGQKTEGAHEEPDAT